MRHKITMFLGIVAAVMLLSSLVQSQQKPGKGNASLVEQGKHIVMMIGQCNDCHTPKFLTPKGPVLDTTRLLSGHPANDKLPDVPPGVIGPDKWGALGSNDFTAWYGPWGTSFTANLTPDIATGLGSWTEEMFIKTMRTGKHMGEGRDLLPPMPWYNLKPLSDQELKAIFAFLHSLKPIENAVPDPISPTGEKIPTPHQAK
jgi:hypothetical protein